MACELLETIEVGVAGASSIEFTGIPNTGIDLMVKVSLRGSNNTERVACNFKINNNTDSGTQALYAVGNGLIEANNYEGVNAPALQGTTNAFSSGTIYIGNYTSSATKSYLIDNAVEASAADTKALMQFGAERRDDTNPVTSVALSVTAGNFVQYSTASLYIIS